MTNLNQNSLNTLFGKIFLIILCLILSIGFIGCISLNANSGVTTNTNSNNTNSQPLSARERMQSEPNVDEQLIEDAIYNAAQKIINVLPPDGSRIAITEISSRDKSISDYILGELTNILVDYYPIVDRGSMNAVNRELNFQMSGAVDDNEVVAIGRMVAANIIITGEITGTGNLRRLRLRVIDIETAVTITTVSEPL